MRAVMKNESHTCTNKCIFFNLILWKKTTEQFICNAYT